MQWRWLCPLLGLACLGVALALVLLVGPGAPLQTGFALRVPLLAGAFLVLLPCLCSRVAPSLLENLSELERPAQFVAVSFAAAVAGMAVVRVFVAAALNLGSRLLVATPPPSLGLVPFLLFEGIALLLAIPTLAWVWARSPGARGVGALLGSLLALTAFFGSYALLVAGDYFGPLARSLGGLLQGAPPGLRLGYLEGARLGSRHLELLVFWSLAFVVYLIGYRAFCPGSRFSAPALVFLLTLFTHVVLFLGGAAFFLDYYRLPLVAVFGGFALASFLLWRIDHRYALRPAPGLPPPTGLDDGLAASLRARLARQGPGPKTLVVVATAGGGIQASGWTAQVLGGLERFLGASFSLRVGFLSAVSGGSVGALYFLDALEDGRLSPPGAERMFAAATASSLEAVGWGLAYPDFWRLLGLPVAREDRGTALETSWALRLREPGASLRSFGGAVRSGAQPFAVFNATLVQTGLRYLLAPLPIRERAKYKSTDFYSLYGGFDLGLATAVRLSATFPYVSPIARNDRGAPVFHVADGGYFDNFGVFTALNFLEDEVLRAPPGRPSLAAALGVERVLLLEIRAFPELPDPPPPGPMTPFVMAVFGPLLALFAMRNSTQTARNAAELRDLERLWDGAELGGGRKLEVKTVQLGFPAEFDRNVTEAFTRRGRYAPPLSWKLSAAQRAALGSAWAYLERNDLELRRLGALWARWHPQEEQA